MHKSWVRFRVGQWVMGDPLFTLMPAGFRRHIVGKTPINVC